MESVATGFALRSADLFRRNNWSCDIEGRTSVFLLLLLHFQLYIRFTIFGEMFAYVTILKSNPGGNHIPSSWIVHVGCVFVAGIHPSRT